MAERMRQIPCKLMLSREASEDVCNRLRGSGNIIDDENGGIVLGKEDDEVEMT
jgi:hypothetical protein